MRLTKNQKAKIKILAKEHKLSLLVLFGSQAGGKTHLESDVDFGFLSEKKMDLAGIAKMQFDFSSQLKIKNLELIDLKTLSPLFLKQIVQKSILLFEKEPHIYANFKIYALKLFMEAKPLLKLREASLSKFLQTV